MELIIKKEDELSMAAEELLRAFPNDRVFCFYGEMGAGKTTFIKEICRQLGAIDITSSPTFAIVNEYITNDDKSIYHFDFYRIDNLNDAYQIGVEDYLYSGNYCFLEWAENIEPLIDDGFVKIRIEIGEDYSRIFHISKAI